MQPDGPNLSALARNLRESLRSELTAVTRLSDLVEAQREALRSNSRQGLDDATYRVSDQLHVLDRHRLARQRQMRLLGRLLQLGDDAAGLEATAKRLAAQPETEELARELLSLRAEVRRRAQAVQRSSEEIGFALQAAVQIGRDLLQTVHDLQAPPPPNVYTPRGSSKQTVPTRSFVNRLG